MAAEYEKDMTFDTTAVTDAISEVIDTSGVEITIGPTQGPKGGPGVCIQGKKGIVGIVRVAVGVPENWCKRSVRWKASCSNCAANLDYPSQVEMFCVKSKGVIHRP